jgi:hypothetical protein
MFATEPATALFTQDDLVGKYDLYFHYGVGPKMSHREQRTTVGTLTLEMRGDEQHQPGRFDGAITRPPHRIGMFAYKVWGMDYDFRETGRREHMYDGSAVLECGITEGDLIIFQGHLNDWPNLDSRVTKCVELRRVQTKLPLFWRGREQDCTEHQKVAETTSLVEAEELVRQHDELYSQNSWMLRHWPQLNAEIARRIHGYIGIGSSRCPPPVLFIEPGDLCITTRWSVGRKGVGKKVTMTSYVFARRRPIGSPSPAWELDLPIWEPNADDVDYDVGDDSDDYSDNDGDDSDSAEE